MKDRRRHKPKRLRWSMLHDFHRDNMPYKFTGQAAAAPGPRAVSSAPRRPKAWLARAADPKATAAGGVPRDQVYRTDALPSWPKAETLDCWPWSACRARAGASGTTSWGPALAAQRLQHRPHGAGRVAALVSGLGGVGCDGPDTRATLDAQATSTQSRDGRPGGAMWAGRQAANQQRPPRRGPLLRWLAAILYL